MMCSDAARNLAYAADRAVYGVSVADSRMKCLSDTLSGWEKVREFVESFGDDWSSEKLLHVYDVLSRMEIPNNQR